MDSQTMLLAPGILFVILLVATGSANAGCVGLETGTDYGCGDTVTESCTFDENMSCSSGHGLIIGASNITIDGKGYILDGVNSVCTWEDIRCGIINDGYDNVVIKNSEFKNFCNGITLRGNSSNHIENNTIGNCNIHHNGNATSVVATHGIKMQYVFNSTIRNNSIHDTIAHVEPNPSCEDGGNGIYLYKGDYNLITQNKFYNNTKGGLFMKYKPMYNNISYNELWGNGQGGIILRCCLCNFNLIEYNNASDNYGSGMFIGGNNNTIRYNTVYNNKNGGPYYDDLVGGHGFGFMIGRSDGSCFNILSSNTACGNDYRDIYVVLEVIGNTGEENTCDTTHNYDDRESTTTGCTYSCSGDPGCMADDGTVFRCGDTVMMNCTFNGSLSCAGGGTGALTIGADNIVIDGAGYELVGNNYNWLIGIKNLNHSGVVVKNLSISEFKTFGIWFSGEPNPYDAMTIDHVIKNCVIENCTVHHIGTEEEAGAQGIFLQGMKNSTIKRNDIYNVTALTEDTCGAGGNGIFFYGGSKAGKPASQHNKIISNWLHNNKKAGFFTKMMLNNSVISYNNASGNTWPGVPDIPGGIVLRCKKSNYNTIAYNNLSNNYGEGLYVGGCHNTVKYNIIISNSVTGINMGRGDGSDYNVLYNNVVCGNTAGDIATCGGTDPTLGCYGNTGDENTCDSIFNYEDKGTIGCTYSCDAEKPAFDTGEGTYPSIFGTHKGEINPDTDIIVNKMYTYPCEGTSGHVEYAMIWNESGWSASASWEGYSRDWHNVSFDETFTLRKGETYYYEIRTGSYPQIVHAREYKAEGGGNITCTWFLDANGKRYKNWIPAIKLYVE